MGPLGTPLYRVDLLPVPGPIGEREVRVRRLHQRVPDLLDRWVLCQSQLQAPRQQGVPFILITCRSLFQAMSVIGYCLIPLSLFGLLISILSNVLPGWVKLIIILLALAWSTVSCLIVMRDLVSEERKWLCAYPILLFYIFLGWYAIVA